MAIQGKYTPQERRIVNAIQDLKSKQRYCRKRWMDIDVKINALEKLLNKKI